jgi:hypothetical protein
VALQQKSGRNLKIFGSSQAYCKQKKLPEMLALHVFD